MKFILIADDETTPISFFPIWEVIGFVLIMVVILVTLFPRHLLVDALASEPPSVISVSYLQAFISINPGNQELRLALTGQQVDLGAIKDAEKNLLLLDRKNLLANPEMALQLRWIDYQIFKFQFYKTTVEKRRLLLPRIQDMGKGLANEPIGINRLKILAMDNIAYHQAPVALKIYQDLMSKKELNTPEELAHGGNIALQNNAHRASAEFYKAAFDKSVTLEDKRKYAIEVMKMLWSGNFTQDAFEYAIKLPEAIVDDPQMLSYISQLSLAANHPDVAQKYALKALLYEHKNNHE